MIVLLDLDGTLVNTAHSSFKPMKDGQAATVIETIPVFDGARDFINNLLANGHTPIILSDSHPNYVNPIARQIFNIQSLCLCDKPNIQKTKAFLEQLGYDIHVKENFIIIGDTWLDIELGRALNFTTILTQFYTSVEIDERDGIGKTWHQLKSGPTYVAKSFAQVLQIIQNPFANLWVAEAIFKNTISNCGIKLHDLKSNETFTLFRSLGRQEVGECDQFGVATSYTEFQREGRSEDILLKLALAVQHYLNHVMTAAPQLHWDYITYVADKSTTKPPNKMGIFFNLVQINILKVKLFTWLDTVDGSIRNRANYRDRRSFINQNLRLLTEIDLNGKSVIVVDDQFTSGGTAYEITNMLRGKGAKNILFLTLFFMTSTVISNRNCSKCGKPMLLKIKKSDGTKFFSCTPPRFRGTGCGHIENIAQ